LIKEINGAIPHALASLAVRHKAGLIHSAARPPYGKLPCYARTRVSRRAATAARLTKRSTSRHYACVKTFGSSQARAAGQLTIRHKNKDDI